MKKLIDTFLKETKLIFVFIFFFFLLLIMSTTIALSNTSDWALVKAFIILDILLSLVLTAIVMGLRLSEKFWDEFRILEKEVKETEDPGEFKILTDRVYELSKSSTGQYANLELVRLKTILEIKSKYLKNE